MAEIKQELTLEDGFSRVMDDFIKRLEDIEKNQTRLIDTYENSNKHLEDMNKGFEHLNRNATNLVNNGLDRLLRKVTVITAAYMGFNKIKQSVTSAIYQEDMSIRFSNQFGNNNMMDYSRQLANEYGMSNNESFGVMANIGKWTTRQSDIDKVYELGARLASINPGASVSQTVNQLSSAIQNRSASGLIDATGLQATAGERYDIQRYLNFGQFENAYRMLDQMANKAGATRQALENMLDSPVIRLTRLSNTMQNIFDKIGSAIWSGLEPALRMFDEFTRTEEFERMVKVISGLFYGLGRVVGWVADFVIQNKDKIIGALKYLAIGFGILTATMVALKIATIAATAAQWAYNIAAMANPVGLITAAIVGLIAVLIAVTSYLMKFVDETSSGFARVIGVIFAFGSILYDVVVGNINNILNFINLFLNVLKSVGNFLYNVFAHPILAVKVLIVDLMASFIEFFANILSTIGTIATFGKDIPVIGKFFGTGGEAALDIAEKISEKGKGIQSKVVEDAEGKGYRRLFNTSEAPQLGLINPQNAYEKGVDIAQIIESLLKGEYDILEKINTNTGNAAKSLNNLENQFDPDSWMDNFSSYAVGNAERMLVTNNTIRAGNTANIVNNITNNYTAEVSLDEIEKRSKKSVRDELDKQMARSLSY